MNTVGPEDWLRAKVIQKRTGQDFDDAYLDRLAELAAEEHARLNHVDLETVRLGLGLLASDGAS